MGAANEPQPTPLFPQIGNVAAFWRERGLRSGWTITYNA